MVEAVTNVAVGLAVSFTANAVLFPLFGWSISAAQNLTLGLVFTAISIVRSYALRRLFNQLDAERT